MQHTSADATPWWQRLFYLLLQLAGFVLLLLLHIIILEQLVRLLFPFMGESEDDIVGFITIWSTGLIAVLGSAFLLDFFQQRLGLAALGFTKTKLGYGISTGLIVGTGIILSSFLVLMAGGWVVVNDFNFELTYLLAWLLFFLIQPLTEEVIMRSVLQSQVHRYFGKQAGLILTALVFAFMHVGNDAFSWVAGLEIFLGGYLMGQLYLKAQNIWAPFMMHASWNFVQSTVLGFAVSGMDTYRLLDLDVNGPDWLTGGKFGLEASWLTIFLISLAIVYFWRTPAIIPWLSEAAKARRDKDNIAINTIEND